MLFYLPVFVNHFAIVLMAVLLVSAAANDVRRYLIPNWICLVIVGLYPVHALTTPLAVNPWLGLAIAAVAFAIGAGLFSFRILGGGDVKLLAAVTLWAGSTLALSFLMVTALCGGALALLLKTPVRRWVPAPPAPVEGALECERVLMPYGVAIAGGGLYVAAHLLGA